MRYLVRMNGLRISYKLSVWKLGKRRKGKGKQYMEYWSVKKKDNIKSESKYIGYKFMQ